MGAVHGKGRFKCKTCHLGFSWRYDLAQHLQHCNTTSQRKCIEKPVEYYLLELCFLCGRHLTGTQSEEASFIKGLQKLYHSKKPLTEVLEIITQDESVSKLDKHTIGFCKKCMTNVNKWDEMNQQLLSLAKSLRSTYRLKEQNKGEGKTGKLSLITETEDGGLSSDSGNEIPLQTEVKTPSSPASNQNVSIKEEPNIDYPDKKDHFQKCQEKEYKCDCGKNVKGLDSFVEHQLREGCKVKTNQFPCKYCKSVFSEKKLLIAHKKECVKATLINGAHSCDICGRRFLVRGRVDTHKRLVHSIGTADQQLCSYCGRTFGSGYNMKNHLAKEHGIGQLEMVVCELCGSKFSDRASLRNHLRNIHGERKYKCETCGKKFASPGLLNHHCNEIHNNTYNYECNECGEQFHVSFKYRYHMKKMHHKLQYACENCDRKFIMRSDLYRHMRGVHMGIRDPKRYPCTICGRLFPSKYKVKRHMSIHGIMGTKTEKMIVEETVNNNEGNRVSQVQVTRDLNSRLGDVTTDSTDGTSIDVHHIPVSSDIYSGTHITTLTPEILQDGVGGHMMATDTMVVGSVASIVVSASPLANTIASELPPNQQPHIQHNTTQQFEQAGSLESTSIIPVQQMIVIQDSVGVPGQFSITPPSSQVITVPHSSVPPVSSQVISASQSNSQVISSVNNQLSSQVISASLHAPTANFTVSLPEQNQDNQKLQAMHYQYFQS